MLIHYSNTFLIVNHDYDAEGVPTYTWWVTSAMTANEQLLVILFMMRTLRMAGLGECDFGPLLRPEDEEVIEVRLFMACWL